MEERHFRQNRSFMQNRKPRRTMLVIRFVLFSIGAFSLLLLNYLQPGPVYFFRRHFNDAAASTLSWLATPVTIMIRQLSDAGDFVKNYQQLEELGKYKTTAQEWENRARHLSHENKKLRENLKYVHREAPVIVSARAFFSFDGRYLQGMIVEAGEEDGVEINQPVITCGRLIGRVVEISPHSCRVLLITDMHSRIPVETEWSLLKGILTGNNNKKLLFLHEREKRSLLEGELVFSTGEGGIFPSGYLVGKIAVGDDGEVFVDPGIEWRKIDIVQILALDSSREDKDKTSGNQEEKPDMKR